MSKIKRFLSIFLVVACLFLAVSCKPDDGGEAGKGLTDEELVQSVINNLKIPTIINKGIDLPTNVDGVNIEWTSEEELLFNKDIFFYVNEGSKYEFKLFATFSYKDIEVSNTYTINVQEGKNSICNVAWDYFKSKIPSATTANITLRKQKEYNGCGVMYKSLNTDIISNDGKVKQTHEDNSVTFLTYITNDNTTIIYPRTILVSGFTDVQCTDKVAVWLKEQVELINKEGGTKYPDYNEEYGTYINWYSLEPGLITANGTIIAPESAKNVTFGCTIGKGDATETLTFKYENFGGTLSKVERLKLWSEGIIDSYIRGTKNYVGDDDHLVDQNRTNINGALNLLTGAPLVIDTTYFIDTTDPEIKTKMWGSKGLGTDTHPDVPQSVLDELFYPGYKMPNEQNILWIVVHESGMPREGQDAKLLAEVQVRNAYSTGRQASWHYQVDEGVVYQSFDDSIICWHAGDGTLKLGGGNNNGIGIEMCINSDGNYEASMRVDAKLVAHLLHKYNLTLENVKRHYDFDGKQCPYYMIETGRWTEFLEYVNREYVAYQYYQEGARFSWSVTDENGEDALPKYFTKRAENVYTNKLVEVETTLTVTLTVTYNGETYSFSKKLKLMPGVGENE